MIWITMGYSTNKLQVMLVKLLNGWINLFRDPFDEVTNKFSSSGKITEKNGETEDFLDVDNDNYTSQILSNNLYDILVVIFYW